MQYLWTPWRMSYVSGAGDGGGEDVDVREESPSHEAQESHLPQADSTGCVFCDRVRLPESHDRASLILLRATHNFVILNLYPYNSAHLMIVPYLHTSDFAGLDAETAGEMVALAQRMVRIVNAEYSPEGYNIGMNLGKIAGAGLADHVHMHLVPRWAGDTNFMPIIGKTKVMPELLERTYDRLKGRLREVG